MNLLELIWQLFKAELDLKSLPTVLSCAMSRWCFDAENNWTEEINIDIVYCMFTLQRNASDPGCEWNISTDLEASSGQQSEQ